jgi:hypothetical protein
LPRAFFAFEFFHMDLPCQQLRKVFFFSATTVSAYFTGKTRNKGWALFERRIIQWIVSQNMDVALVENPNDEGLLQEVQICKEIQRSLVEEFGNCIQPTKDRLWTQESGCVSDNDYQFYYKPQVIIPSHCQRDLWMCSNDVHFDNYCCTPNLSEKNDYNAEAEFDLFGLQQHPQTIVECQLECAPQYYYHYGIVETSPHFGHTIL